MNLANVSYVAILNPGCSLCIFMYYYFIFIYDTLITFAFTTTKSSIEPFSINKSYHYLDIGNIKQLPQHAQKRAHVQNLTSFLYVRAEGLEKEYLCPLASKTS